MEAHAGNDFDKVLRLLCREHTLRICEEFFESTID